MYKLIKSAFTGEIHSVQRLSHNAFIAMNEANSDYQAYLKWVSEGNTPLPADK